MEREVQARTGSTEVRDLPKSSNLVNALGSLSSIIAHHLNQPSLTTDGKFGNETAGKSNPCIAMVMGNGFQEGESLIFDHIHRREPKSRGLMKYPQAVLSAHEDRTRYIMASSAAKVEVCVRPRSSKSNTPHNEVHHAAFMGSPERNLSRPCS